jgi:uncharacterized protein YprB with RNaseH-like and TPR domain
MSKFTNRLSRLHQSRIRALDHAEDRPNGVYDADNDVPTTVIRPPSTPISCPWTKAGARGPDLHFVNHHRQAIGNIGLAEARCSLPVSWSEQTSLIEDIPHDRVGFFDIETNGLGTECISFCLGLAYWNDEGLEVTQWILEDPIHERRTLESLACALKKFDAVVTFNGASFDLPRVIARMAHHNLDSPFERLVHVDLLRVARRLLPRQSMSLPDLERKILGIHRQGDIPGSEAPIRWNTYARTGVISGLLPLFTHNSQDVISLVALNASFVRILRPEAALTTRWEPAPESSALLKRQPDDASMQERLNKVYRLRSGRSTRRGTPSPEPTSTPGANYLGARIKTLRVEAMALIKAGNSDEALPLLHEMVALSPANPFPLAELARYYVANNELELARIFEARLKGLGMGL